MTKYCLQERAKVYEAYLNYFNNSTKENWLNYIKLVDDFKYRFHKRFDPLNLADDYDILGITLRRKEGKPFIPMELENSFKKMITEDYVSFEIAKLLKEKGFDEGCSFVVNTISKGVMPVSWPTTNSDIEDEEASLIALPTLQMAMKWLREDKKIFISIFCHIDKGYWFCIQYFINSPYKFATSESIHRKEEILGKIQYYDTYEQSVEAAIKYCLENLI